MNIILVTKVMTTYRMTDVMVNALMTGKDESGQDSVIQSGPKQIKALAERGLVSSTSHYLTEPGQLAYRLFKDGDMPSEEASTLLNSAPVSGTSGGYSSGTFLVSLPETIEGLQALSDMFPADAVKSLLVPSENGEGVPWAEAKVEIREFGLLLRNLGRDILQANPKIRKADVMADAENAEQPESDAEESSDDAEQPLFSEQPA